MPGLLEDWLPWPLCSWVAAVLSWCEVGCLLRFSRGVGRLMGNRREDFCLSFTVSVTASWLVLWSKRTKQTCNIRIRICCRAAQLENQCQLFPHTALHVHNIHNILTGTGKPPHLPATTTITKRKKNKRTKSKQKGNMQCKLNAYFMDNDRDHTGVQTSMYD